MSELTERLISIAKNELNLDNSTALYKAVRVIRAVKKLPDKWRDQCGGRKTTQNHLKIDCADELKKILDYSE